jgi:hypothetical protein
MIHKIIGALFRKHGAKTAQVIPLFWKQGKTAAHDTTTFPAKLATHA